MEPGLAHELGVERRHEEVPLLQDDGPVLEFGQDLDPVPDPLDPGRPDEDPPHAVVDPAHVEVRLERLHLTPVGVPSHRDVHQAEQRFTTFDLRGYLQATDRLLLTAGIENFGDRLYREHLDPIAGNLIGYPFYRPGTNFYFASQFTY